jgi:hypothetical protein
VEGFKADDATQKAVLVGTIELMKGDKLGVSSEAAWSNTQEVLVAMGQVKEKMAPSSFYTNEFVP